MKSAFCQRARELGFDACRVTTAAPPETRGHLAAWLAAGRHGEMAYLERNAAKRSDPQLVLPGARSVLVLAASYHEPRASAECGARSAECEQRAISPLPTSTKNTLLPNHQPSTINHQPSIARYARYADYHLLLGRQLQSLAEYIEQTGGPGTRALWYVDTGPILERDLAQRAGLGFIGKHTNLISRELGNWFFIAEILTTLELEPDPPEKNRCGSCARCLAACPTRAITAPFELDARRCISYLTIELKGPIPLELRPLIGNRIFGCDDCLAACPWNKFARAGRLMQTQSRPDLEVPDLLELLALDDVAFKQRFAGTPMLRAKRRGLLRNVCVALGNTGDDRALPALERAAADPEPLIAEHARWAIAQIQARAETTPRH